MNVRKLCYFQNIILWEYILVWTFLIAFWSNLFSEIEPIFLKYPTLRLITNCNYVFPLIHKRKNSITKLMLMYFTFWCRILNFWCLFFLKMSSQTLSMANWDNLSCQKITFKTLTLSTGKERKFHSYLICNWRRSLKDVNCTPFVVKKKFELAKGKKGFMVHPQ